MIHTYYINNTRGIATGKRIIYYMGRYANAKLSREKEIPLKLVLRFLLSPLAPVPPYQHTVVYLPEPYTSYRFDKSFTMLICSPRVTAPSRCCNFSVTWRSSPLSCKTYYYNLSTIFFPTGSRCADGRCHCCHEKKKLYK